MSRARAAPPLGEPLEFVRHDKTGTVHILPWDDSEPVEVPAGQWGEHAAAAVLGPAPEMLCGTRLRYVWPGSPGGLVAGDRFNDSDLCVRCVRALGEQSWRAFHPDNRESQ